MNEIKIGKYKHMKTGNIYEVIGIGTHTENEEKYVIYKEENKNTENFWIRPISIFQDIITFNEDGPIPRFKYLGDV